MYFIEHKNLWANFTPSEETPTPLVTVYVWAYIPTRPHYVSGSHFVSLKSGVICSSMAIILREMGNGIYIRIYIHAGKPSQSVVSKRRRRDATQSKGNTV